MFDAKVVTILIASPSDVITERDHAEEVIHEWNAVNAATRRVVLLPIRWEVHATPEMGAHPQDVLNRQLVERSDVVVCIFWTRLGTPTTHAPSGSAEELEAHIATGRPALLYFSQAPTSLAGVDLLQWQQLQTYRTQVETRGFVSGYDDVGGFVRRFRRDLAKTMNELVSRDDRLQAPATVLASSSTSGDRLSVLQRELLQAVAADSHGELRRVPYDGGEAVLSNRRDFREGLTPREAASLETALEGLLTQKLLRDKDGRQRRFELTGEAYALLDTLGTGSGTP